MSNFEIVKGMNQIILGSEDENLIDVWFMYGVPDGADDTDIKQIAYIPKVSKANIRGKEL